MIILLRQDREAMRLYDEIQINHLVFTYLKGLALYPEEFRRGD